LSTQLDSLRSLKRHLEQSPLFRVSLSSKELFHSDFLAWLCETYPQPLIKIFSKSLSDSSNLAGKWKVEREKNHVDLTFTFIRNDGDKRILLVENKVKSTPYLEQLTRIADTHPDKQLYSFLLLSVIKPDFAASHGKTISLEEGTLWHVLDYRELAGELELIVSNISNEYHVSLIRDYAEFITLLSKLVDSVQVDFQGDKNFFAYKELLPLLTELRLHDLVQKRIFTDLADFISNELQREFQVVRNAPERDGVGKVYVTQDFSRGTGMLSVNCPVAVQRLAQGPPRLAIQLQDQTFKLYSYACDDLEHSEHVADQLAKSGLWFNFDVLPEASIVPQKLKKEGKFNSYFGTHRYQYRKINNLSAKDIAAITIEYVRYIHANMAALTTVMTK
jgi:hypothetical protein